MFPSALSTIFQGLFWLSIAIAVVLGSTWIITSVRFHTQVQRLRTAKAEDEKTEPPTLPYSIPWLGSAVGFLVEQGSFWANMRHHLGVNLKLCTVRMGPASCYILSGSENIQSLFKMSRHFSTDKLERQIMISCFGLPGPDLDIIQQPARTDKGKASSSHMGKRNRKFDVESQYQQFLLTPHAVNCLTAKYLEVLTGVLDAAPEIPPLVQQGGEEAGWASVNLYEWLKEHVFTASTTAFLGSRVLEMNPSFARDFWAFDENMLKILYGLPRFLARRGHQARDDLMDGASRWLEDANSHGDIDIVEDWDPYFGSRFIREREKLNQRSGLCRRSRAAINIGLLFGISSNSIPSIGWMLMHILTSPASLQSRLLAELQTTILINTDSPDSSKSSPTLSVPHLVSPIHTPLLHSIYSETLRHYVAINLSRDVKSACTIDSHLLKPGGLVMAPSWVMHRSNEHWTDPPPSIFYPERFLIRDEKTGDVTFSTAGTAGKFFPFGGGAHVCPGRIFAKQEILATVATILLDFDLTFVNWVDPSRGSGGKEVVTTGGVDGHGFPSHKNGTVGLGVMAMQWDARVRIRRRTRKTGTRP